MTDGESEARALRPLWLLTTGALAGSAGTSLITTTGPSWLPTVLVIFGVVSLLAAFQRGPQAHMVLWIAAGFALVGGRGLDAAGDRLQLERYLQSGETVVRARLVVVEGWIDSRWGYRTRVLVDQASIRGATVDLPRRCRLEVRGVADVDDLPEPGRIVDTLVRLRGESRSPLLVASGGRLLTDSGRRRVLPTLRDWLARSLITAAKTDVERIRAAEMAATLSLGRRDLIPADRRDRWRRSGLAHLLAVSGLHVGLVGGAVWLLMVVAGAGPRTTRAVVLIVLPAYALLAGAAPSAMRAALMGMVYLGARLLGRAILPMAAVLLTAFCLLLARPELVTDVGFQLTVVITAALVRWVPPLTVLLRGPRAIAGAAAVPIVAQTAAAPIVAWHFRTLIPGALIANLIALPLLAPTVLASVAGAALAPVFPAGAGLCLGLVGRLSKLLLLGSTPARALELVTPPVPATIALAMAAAGWLALQAGRRARVGAWCWVAGLALSTGLWLLPARASAASVEVLPVSDGAAVLIRDGADSVLSDGGRYLRESSELLAASRRKSLSAVLASHTDEDHIGGLARVLRTLNVEQLILPTWMATEVETVPLLRAARRRGVRVRPVARGSVVGLGSLRLVVLWPPAKDLPRHENERSLVARLEMDDGTVLITSDIGKQTENRISNSASVRCDILAVPHHGSRGSSSDAFLNATSPSIALVPAAPGNTHGHPHRAVLDRLWSRGITVRVPMPDTACGARWDGERWMAYP